MRKQWFLIFLVAAAPFGRVKAGGLSSWWQKLRGAVKGGGSDKTNDNCAKIQLGLSDCAILFHHEGCNGWNMPLSVGYHALPRSKKNDAEAVIVKKGCELIGYDHHDTEVAGRGKSVKYDATRLTGDLTLNLKGWNDLRKSISAAECKCNAIYPQPYVNYPGIVVPAVPAAPAEDSDDLLKKHLANYLAEKNKNDNKAQVHVVNPYAQLGLHHVLRRDVSGVNKGIIGRRRN